MFVLLYCHRIVSLSRAPRGINLILNSIVRILAGVTIVINRAPASSMLAHRSLNSNELSHAYSSYSCEPRAPRFKKRSPILSPCTVLVIISVALASPSERDAIVIVVDHTGTPTTGLVRRSMIIKMGITACARVTRLESAKSRRAHGSHVFRPAGRFVTRSHKPVITCAGVYGPDETFSDGPPAAVYLIDGWLASVKSILAGIVRKYTESLRRADCDRARRLTAFKAENPSA